MRKKICCVTGHRDIPAEKTDYVKQELHREIQLAVQDGYTHFVSGFAEATDLYFAEIVAELKTENPNITLEAALPYRKRLNAKNQTFQHLIKLCDEVHVTAETYSKGSYINRNIYMVGKSERVIAVYDGRESGGTDFTVRYGRTQKRELRIISV
jgi:uncharacterized phage-like protein YoqJ